jgi:hypothetical protein
MMEGNDNQGILRDIMLSDIIGSVRGRGGDLNGPV